MMIVSGPKKFDYIFAIDSNMLNLKHFHVKSINPADVEKKSLIKIPSMADNLRKLNPIWLKRVVSTHSESFPHPVQCMSP